MTKEEMFVHLNALKHITDDSSMMWLALDMAIKELEQESCEDVCEWFEQYVDIATDIVELRFSDGTVKRAKRGLYMRDIEESIRKMLIDQIANEKKQEPCEDAISRQAVLEIVERVLSKGDALFEIEQLPPVTPQPKTGHWIIHTKGIITTRYICSECNRTVIDDTDYSPYKDYPFCHCGAKMIEPQESEVEE